MGNLCPDEIQALEANLNQSMIFISPENIPFLRKKLEEFSKEDLSRLIFAKDLLKQIKKYIVNSKDESTDLAPKLKSKLNALENQLLSFEL